MQQLGHSAASPTRTGQDHVYLPVFKKTSSLNSIKGSLSQSCPYLYNNRRGSFSSVVSQQNQSSPKTQVIGHLQRQFSQSGFDSFCCRFRASWGAKERQRNPTSPLQWPTWDRVTRGQDPLRMNSRFSSKSTEGRISVSSEGWCPQEVPGVCVKLSLGPLEKAN